MYQTLCYNYEGKIIAELFTKEFPTKKQLPSGTVRVDIALPF